MTIISKTIGSVGQVGVTPRRIQMVVTDALSVVTTANYLQADHLLPDVIYPTDIIDMIYLWNASTHTGVYVELLVSITAGIITLNAAAGSDIGPTVAGDFAVFSDTSGGLEDLGYLPSNAAKLRVVMANAATIVGQVPMFTDVNGTIGDSGILAANYAPLTAVVTMTAAQVDGAYAAPFVLIAAPGAGFGILLLSAAVVTEVSTAFATGGVAIVQYGATVHGAGTNALSATIPAAEITAASSQIYSMTGYVPTTVTATTAVSGLGVYFSNATQAFTLGTGSTVTVALQYMVVPIV